MSDFSTFDDGTLARHAIDATIFRDSELWRAIVAAELTPERARIMRDLENPSTPAERLKFVQGELKQVNRAIMLVDDFLRDVAASRKRRQSRDEAAR